MLVISRSIVRYILQPTAPPFTSSATQRKPKERERENLSEREREALEMDLMGKLSFVVFIFCVMISLKEENAETRKGLPTFTLYSFDSNSTPVDLVSSHKPLEYDFYHDTCPQAEKIIRSRVRRLYEIRSDVPPSLLRLVFHDCFIEVKFLVPPS